MPGWRVTLSDPARRGRLRRKWRAWRNYPLADRALIVEAALWLAMARLAVVLVPFRYIASWLERRADAPPSRPGLPARVGRAVLVAAGHVPWNAVCLPQALAAKMMLARRGQGAVFHLGARLDEQGNIAAHAWLVCDGEVVTGAAGMAGMAPLVKFG